MRRQQKDVNNKWSDQSEFALESRNGDIKQCNGGPRSFLSHKIFIASLCLPMSLGTFCLMLLTRLGSSSICLIVLFIFEKNKGNLVGEMGK